MDPWLTDHIKELMFRPCLQISGHIGQRLDNRRRMDETIDERALTEDFVDHFDSSSSLSAWNGVANRLEEHQIYLNTGVKKSTREHHTGADIGLVITRAIYQTSARSNSTYAVLIQCKRVDHEGVVEDFHHEVKSSGRSQASLMLDITPSSFYFIFTPPSLLKTYCTFEPLAFAAPARGCSSPVWNMGCFEFDSPSLPFLSAQQKAEATGVLVVPALAVEAQESKGKAARIDDILPNALPLWYWFGELLVPGFIGDHSKKAVSVARNVFDPDHPSNQEFGVRHSVDFGFGNG